MLLNQNCDNCIFRNNPYKTVASWCAKNPMNTSESDWCEGWVTDEIDIGDYYGGTIITMDDLKHFIDFVRARVNEN